MTGQNNMIKDVVTIALTVSDSKGLRRAELDPRIGTGVAKNSSGRGRNIGTNLNRFFLL